MLRSVFRYAALGAAVALSLAVAAGPAMAQTPYAAPPPSGAPPASPAEKPPAAKTTMGMLEGAVKKVDPGTGTLQVSSGPFGVFRRTLDVTADTQIQMEGRQGTLADIPEGANVKASYETREGKNLATRIEVMPASEKSDASRAPGRTQ